MPGTTKKPAPVAKAGVRIYKKKPERYSLNLSHAFNVYSPSFLTLPKSRSQKLPSTLSAWSESEYLDLRLSLHFGDVQAGAGARLNMPTTYQPTTGPTPQYTLGWIGFVSDGNLWVHGIIHIGASATVQLQQPLNSSFMTPKGLSLTMLGGPSFDLIPKELTLGIGVGAKVNWDPSSGIVSTYGAAFINLSGKIVSW